jgi:hypothetical protein
VNFVSSRFGALAAVAIVFALSGCGNFDFDTSQFFSKPLDFVGHAGGYTFSELQETRQERPITPNDLVQQNGACPAPPAPPQEQASPNSPALPNNPGATPAAAADTDSLLGAGISLGMSECDVVYRAGQPSGVQLGQSPNGERTAVLTFQTGVRSGIYRFERGRLVEMDRVAEQPSPPPQAAKKKPAKTKTSQE